MPSPSGFTFALPASLTGNAQVDSLIYGTYWMDTLSNGTFSTALTYSFMTTDSYFARSYSDVNEYTSGYVLSSAQQSAIVSALGKWSSVADIKFTQVSESSTNVGDLRFGGYGDMDDNTAAWGYFPGLSASAGDVWIGPATSDPSPVQGSYDYLTFVHEIGHALGLKHPFSPGPNNPTVLAAQYDDVRYTVMSYHNSYSYEPTSPMLLDIAAIQSLYGANTLWQTGNNTYSWAADQSVFETIWDAGGNDTIDASNQLSAVRINLNEGQFSKIGQAFLNTDTNTAFNEGLAIAYGAKIENAVGSANDDTLIGNALGNVLNGLAGKDIMIGGAGNDTYVVDDVGDVVSEDSTLAGEIDTVRSSVSWGLGANLENLTLTGNDNLNGLGNALANVLTGNAGNNVLVGGAGADTLIGGAGNDTYVVDNVGDVISEDSSLAGGIDIVRSSVSWGLGANLENLTLTGNDNINGLGNALDNVLTGNAGNNVLVSGAGQDTLIGGAGDDIYVLDNIGDTVTELSGEGHDLIRTSVSYTLSANVEDGQLVGLSAINLTGNALDNRLTGNTGANLLDGGLGADTLIGGAGNDTYVVDDVGDVISEDSTLAGEIDTVRSSVSWGLGANLDNLTLTGNANLNGIGNGLANVLTGNAGNNVLVGGAGQDTLIGGAGDDLYVVDNIGDTVTELADEGHDLVRTAVTYTLSADVEDGQLIGISAINLVGNAAANSLVGNSADNVLNGLGGADTMEGGAGNDSYVVDSIGDTVIEQGTSLTEIDSVFSSVSYLLGSNLEVLKLVGTGNLDGTGNALDNRLTGNVGSNLLDGGLGADTLIGGAGNDTYVVDNVGDVISEDSSLAGEIDTVRSSVSWGLGANLENLTLTGNDNLNGLGNALDNVLTGNAGNNVLVGGAGQDTLIGGAGDDLYVLDNIGDTVTELSGEGHDLIRTSVSYTLSANVEDGQLVGLSAINLTGNALDNRLTGNTGANLLDGGLGADTLIGGAGNDTYVVDNVGDVISEDSSLAGEIDTVRSSVSWGLGANLENLTLTGNDNLNGLGNALANVLTGNAGNNVLVGGAGADTLIGGAGNDTYVVDNVGDVIIEDSSLAGGIDIVRSSVSWGLGANLENLTLTGNDNINGLGNALDNVLTGNAGNNVLVSGAGQDTLIGGAGDDLYVLDNIGDTVTELSGEGHDLIRTSVSYTLSTNVEDGQLVGLSAINLTGNALDNSLIGNSAANVLNGLDGADTLDGGAGNDQLDGGAGNDVLIGGIGTDTLTGGAGADRFVFSALNELGIGGARDVILDFSRLLGDKLDLSKLDANILATGINQFSFIDSADFSGAGQLRFVDHVLAGNIDGNLGADFEIQLVGVNTFSANDLVV